MFIANWGFNESRPILSFSHPSLSTVLVIHLLGVFPGMEGKTSRPFYFIFSPPVGPTLLFLLIFSLGNGVEWEEKPQKLIRAADPLKGVGKKLGYKEIKQVGGPH